MNIVRVEHDRCDEYDKTVYFVAPDGVTPEQFEADVREAQKAYEEARAAFEKATPPTPPFYAHYNMYGTIDQVSLPDEMTVGEIKAARAADDKAQKEYDDLRRAETGSFYSRMAERGYRLLNDVLYEMVESQKIPSAVADWGHRHGQNLDY